MLARVCRIAAWQIAGELELDAAERRLEGCRIRDGEAAQWREMRRSEEHHPAHLGREAAERPGGDRPGIDVSGVRDDRADRGGSSRSDRQESLDMTLQSLGIFVVELPRHGWMANSHPAIVSRTGSV